MASTKITSGDPLAGAAIESGNDGSLVIQTGPAGAKVNALALTSDGTMTLNKPMAGGSLTLATAQATTSGTSIDFTGIPSWVKRITVMLAGVSTNGGSPVQVQLGAVIGGVETTGYNAASAIGLATNTFSTTAITTGFAEASGAAAVVRHGSAILSLMDLSTNLWSMTYNIGTTDTQRVFLIYGTKSLSGALDRIRLTTVNGTDTFDAGSVNILYEG